MAETKRYFKWTTVGDLKSLSGLVSSPAFLPAPHYSGKLSVLKELKNW